MATSSVWCGGLPLIATRPLAMREIAWLRRRERQARYVRRILEVVGVSALLTAATLVVITANHSRHTGSDAFIVGFAAIPLGLITASVCAYGARRWRARAIAVVDGISHGHVLIFNGVPSGSKLLSRFDLFAHPVTFEVLRSGILYSVRQMPVRQWVEQPLTETADVPRDAAVARAVSLPLSDGSTVTVGQRALSQAELDELKKFFRRLKLDYLVSFPVLLSVYLGLAGTHFRETQEWWPSLGVVVAAAIGMAGSIGFLLFWIGPRTRVGRDVRDASVIVVISESSAEEPAERHIHVSEYLEHSHMPWSEDGVPAAWRVDAKLAGA